MGQKVAESKGALMKTTYKFIHFLVIDIKHTTKVWACCNTGTETELGRVKWFSPWRQYCFFPFADIVFSTSCLEDICHFIKQLNS